MECFYSLISSHLTEAASPKREGARVEWWVLLPLLRYPIKLPIYLSLFLSQFLVFKVIPQYCIAHPYCARFLRH